MKLRGNKTKITGGIQMNYTQNQKIMQVKETSLVVGVDIGSEEHYARGFNWRGLELGKVLKFRNDSEGFGRFIAWMEELKVEHELAEEIIGVEPTGHYWFGLGEYLKNRDRHLVMVNPFHVKRSKELDDNLPSKTDIKDPKTIAKLVIEGRYSEPNILEGVYAELRVSNNNRLNVIKKKNRVKNQVEKWLQTYFPEYKEVFKDWTGKGSMLLLKKVCLPDEVLNLDVEEINKIWRDYKLRAVGKKRAKHLKIKAKNSIGKKEGQRAAKRELMGFLAEYELLQKQEDELLLDLVELLKEIPNSDMMLEIKGVGLSTVASFIAEIGDIKNYNSPKQIQKLAGLALKENSSGKHKGRTSIAKRGRKRLRTTLFQVAMPLIGRVEEFKEIHKYYTTREKNPLKKKQSIIAISCKLIRVFYAILTKGIKYSASKLVTDIRRPEVQQAA